MSQFSISISGTSYSPENKQQLYTTVRFPSKSAAYVLCTLARVQIKLCMHLKGAVASHATNRNLNCIHTLRFYLSKNMCQEYI